MQKQKNSRGYHEYFVIRRHSKLDELKQEGQRYGLKSKYLYKIIPEDLLRSTEFHVSLLKHDTNESGLRGIREDEGFKDPRDGKKDPHQLPLVWWSLAVEPEEIRSAETRLKKQVEEQKKFLWESETSPAFSEKSRLGSYRFTFPLKEVLDAYREQVCSGADPVMRVFKTSFYKQEVLYAVLVHSPANNEDFKDYPELTDDPDAVCSYTDGHFIWRPESLFVTHEFKSKKGCDDAKSLFYVWDHVGLALHVERGQVLKFDSDQLRKNLKVCEEDVVKINRRSDGNKNTNPKDLIDKLWPNWTPPQEVEPSLEEKLSELTIGGKNLQEA